MGSTARKFYSDVGLEVSQFCLHYTINVVFISNSQHASKEENLVEGMEVVCKFEIIHYQSRYFPICDFTFPSKLIFAAVLCPCVEVDGLFKDQKS